MDVLHQFAAFFVAMLLLAVASAFYSCSEAALFSLRPDQRRDLERSGAAGKIAAGLLARPQRLLSAILFWNLIINIVYFALASVVGIQLERAGRRAEAAIVAIVALLGLIVVSEMLPKTFGVQQARTLAPVLSWPLSAAVRALDPLMPLLDAVQQMLRRLLFPHFENEAYLELGDLEQAITLSTADKQLAAQERSALQMIVSLSELRADELMRPRRQYQSFSPPVHLDQLGGQLTRSGYLLVTEPSTDEIAAAIPLKHLPNVPRRHLERFANPVVYVPWCASVASILELLESAGGEQCEVAAVVNEMGETIGIVTLEDVLETIFEDETSRSARLLGATSIERVDEQCWRVTGITSLRRLGRHFGVPLPATKSMTVAGVLQERLGRVPEQGDVVQWNDFEFRVTEAFARSPLIAELRLLPPGDAPR